MAVKAFLMLHGINHNLFGKRDPKQCGTITLAQIDERLQALAKELGVAVETYQSNDEGEMCERIHQAYVDNVDGVLVFGVSRRNLHNIFLPSQVTPHAWIQNARLDRACALLEESRVASGSVASIAASAGSPIRHTSAGRFAPGSGSRRQRGARARAEPGHSRALHDKPWPLHKMASASAPSLLT